MTNDYTPVPPSGPGVPAPAPAPVLRPRVPFAERYTKTHALFALFALFLGSLYYRLVLLSGFADPYYDETFPFGLFLFALVYEAFFFGFFAVRKKAFPSVESISLGAMTLLCALRGSVEWDPIYANDDVQVYAALFAHLFALLFAASFGYSGDDSLTARIVPGGIKAVFAAPFVCFHTLFPSLCAVFVRGKKENAGDADKRIEKAIYIVIGVLIALPIAGVVLALLVSDSFFEGFGRGAADFFDSVTANLGAYFNLFTLLISCFFFSALYHAAKKKEKRAVNVAVLPSAVFSTVLVILLALYAVFFLAQGNGFLSLVLGRLPADTTYAEFARTGFFELCAVAVINGAVLYAANVFTGSGENRLVKRLSVILAAATLVLLATAAGKMALYIAAYGFTEKRLQTLWAMALLAAIFAFVIVKLKKDAFALSRVASTATCVWIIVLLYVDFDRFAALLNG